MRAATRAQLKSVREFVEKFRSSAERRCIKRSSVQLQGVSHPESWHACNIFRCRDRVRKVRPSKPEEMKQYERLVAMIKPKHISVANLGALKASEVVRQVATRLGKRFTQNMHVKCWKLFNTRPSARSAAPEVCDNRYCYYDALHKDYVYLPAWVDFLEGKLGDAATPVRFDRPRRQSGACRSLNGNFAASRCHSGFFR